MPEALLAIRNRLGGHQRLYKNKQEEKMKSNNSLQSRAYKAVFCKD